MNAYHFSSRGGDLCRFAFLYVIKKSITSRWCFHFGGTMFRGVVYIYDFLAGFQCVLQCLICTAFVVFYITNQKICTVDHITVSCLDCCLKMCRCRFLTKFNFIVVFCKRFRIIAICSTIVRHNPYQGTVCIKNLLLNTQNSGRCNLIKIAVATYQKINILIIANKLSYQFFHSVFDIGKSVNIPMTDKGYCIDVQYKTTFSISVQI